MLLKKKSVQILIKSKYKAVETLKSIKISHIVTLVYRLFRAEMLN